MLKEKIETVKRRLEALTKKYECGTKIVMPAGGIAVIEDAICIIDFLEKENMRLKQPAQNQPKVNALIEAIAYAALARRKAYQEFCSNKWPLVEWVRRMEIIRDAENEIWKLSDALHAHEQSTPMK